MEYFTWLTRRVRGDYFNPNRYTKLLKHLHATEFTYDMRGDGNRAVDGIELRDKFEDSGAGVLTLKDRERSCSILEMMVALAVRCEEHIMYDPEVGDRVSLWFKVMLVSLRLDDDFDDHYKKSRVDDILYSFLNREYSPDGLGGLFYIPNFEKDMRDIEIWYQMQAFMIRRWMPPTT